MAKPDRWGWTLYWGTEWGKKTFQIKQHLSFLLTSGLPPSTNPHLGTKTEHFWYATHFPFTSNPASKVRKSTTFQQEIYSLCCKEVLRTKWRASLCEGREGRDSLNHHSRGLTAQLKKDSATTPGKPGLFQGLALHSFTLLKADGKSSLGLNFQTPSCEAMIPSVVQWYHWRTVTCHNDQVRPIGWLHHRQLKSRKRPSHQTYVHSM